MISYFIASNEYELLYEESLCEFFSYPLLRDFLGDLDDLIWSLESEMSTTLHTDMTINMEILKVINILSHYQYNE